MIDERTGFLLLAILMGALAVGTALVLYLRHLRAERARWARYSSRGRSEPRSVSCPTCRLRIYSERAIRDRRCPRCGGTLPPPR